MTSTRSESALEGTLLGLALGDALGFVVEAEPPETAREYVATVLRAGRAGERHHARFPFGQYSDDTQLARELLLLAAIIVDTVPHPALPQVGRKARVVVPRRAEEVVLALVREDGQARAAGGPVAPVVEDGRQVLDGPLAVYKHRVGRVDGFEPVVQRAAAGPHFAEHGVPEVGLLAVHGLEEAAAQAA